MDNQFIIKHKNYKKENEEVEIKNNFQMVLYDKNINNKNYLNNIIKKEEKKDDTILIYTKYYGLNPYKRILYNLCGPIYNLT